MNSVLISSLVNVPNKQIFHAPIECLAVAKSNQRPTSNYFFVLLRDKSGEITGCFEKMYFSQFEPNNLYRISGFTVKDSTAQTNYTSKIIFSTFNFSSTLVKNNELLSTLNKHREFGKLYKYIHTVEELDNVANSGVVNIKCRYNNECSNRINNQFYLLTVHLENACFKLKLDNFSDVKHISHTKFITIKRVNVVRSGDQNSILLCSTPFTEIFKCERIPKSLKVEYNNVEIPMVDILKDSSGNKKYIKTCRIIYFRFDMFYKKCSACGRKIGSIHFKNNHCENCDNTSLASSYSMFVEITAAEVDDIEVENPFTILCYNECAEMFLRNTSKTIQEYITDHQDTQYIIQHFEKKTIGCVYKFVIQIPYVKAPYDKIFKRFVGETCTLEKSNDYNYAEIIPDDKSCIRTESETLSESSDGTPTKKTQKRIKDTNADLHNSNEKGTNGEDKWKLSSEISHLFVDTTTSTANDGRTSTQQTVKRKHTDDDDDDDDDGSDSENNGDGRSSKMKK